MEAQGIELLVLILVKEIKKIVRAPEYPGTADKVQAVKSHGQILLGNVRLVGVPAGKVQLGDRVQEIRVDPELVGVLMHPPFGPAKLQHGYGGNNNNHHYPA